MRDDKKLTERDIERVLAMLATTDMTMEEIGSRVGVGGTKISRINVKYNVRQHSGNGRRKDSTPA